MFLGHLLPPTNDVLSGASDTYRRAVTGEYDVVPSTANSGYVNMATAFNYILEQIPTTEENPVVISSESEEDE